MRRSRPKVSSPAYAPQRATMIHSSPAVWQKQPLTFIVDRAGYLRVPTAPLKLHSCYLSSRVRTTATFLPLILFQDFILYHNGICTLCPPCCSPSKLAAFAESHHFIRTTRSFALQDSNLGRNQNADRNFTPTGQSSSRSVRRKYTNSSAFKSFFGQIR